MSDVVEQPWHVDVALPVLLAAARSTYGSAIRRRLHAAGFDDMPRGGARAVGGISRGGTTVSLPAAGLGLPPAATERLVQALVERGYLAPTPPDAARGFTLTERGESAAREIRIAVDDVDGDLVSRVGIDEYVRARRFLAALVDLDREHERVDVDGHDHDHDHDHDHHHDDEVAVVPAPRS